jgi:hypothetical protein
VKHRRLVDLIVTLRPSAPFAVSMAFLSALIRLFAAGYWLLGTSYHSLISRLPSAFAVSIAALPFLTLLPADHAFHQIFCL